MGSNSRRQCQTSTHSLPCTRRLAGKADINQQLWAIAERYTPKQRIADYTQAIMDLGATICTRTQPACTSCPLAKHCQAHFTDKKPLSPHAPRVKFCPSVLLIYCCYVMLKKEKYY